MLEEVENFCYLGSIIASNGSCDKEIRTRLGRANATFGKLNNVWRNKRLSIVTKTRLYRALVLTTLLYGAETWPMTKANMKKLEAAHHRWQRRILGITWKDKIRNEEIRKMTSLEKLEEMLKRARLRWLGHVGLYTCTSSKLRKNHKTGTGLDSAEMEKKARKTNNDMAKYNYARPGGRRDDLGRN